MNKTNLILITTTLALLSSCSLAPDFSLPEITLPEVLKNEPAQPDKERVSEDKWWQEFGSEELSSLIARTNTENNDLIAASARVEQAQALAKQIWAPLFPGISASGDAQRNFNNKPSAIQSGAQNSYNAGAQLSYELDLFGRLRNAADAADESAVASEYDREALRLSTTAQTAETYFDLLAINKRITAAVDNLKNARDILAITQSKFDSGAISELELAQQRNLTENEQAALTGLQQQREATRNLLAVLLSETPESFATKETFLDKLSPPAVAPVLPAELIARRPDIKSLEASLRAANFNIGAARAAFFPSLDLSAGSALAATPASAPAKVLSSLAASITTPLFTGGELEGGLENATARQKELAANYRKVVLTAFSEAENALYGVKTSETRLKSLTAAADNARKAYNASMTRFKVGAVDYVTLLTTQNSLFQAEDALAQARADRLTASVELFKALGGGWD